MSDIILHHFDASPFAEKIRKIFGVKNIGWKSVIIPMTMPKPDLMALTGGYRKTPVMQIGADIYCDTFLIARELDKRFPSPRLFKAGMLAAAASYSWGGRDFFAPGAALSLHENRAHIPKAVADDRRDYFRFLDFDRFEEDAPHFRSQVRAHARLVEDALSDGRAFLAGEEPGAADIDAWFNFWMARSNIPSSQSMFEGMERIAAWRARMAQFGEGSRTEISAEDAIAVARGARAAEVGASTPDESGARPGDAVNVAAADYGKDPVEGVLIFASDDEIVIARQSERAGAVHVHFPRIGFEIRRAQGPVSA